MKIYLPAILFFACISLAMVNKSRLVNQDGQSDKTDDLTISYTIEVFPASKSGEFKETYNGASKTIFASNNVARLRLVSLMRIQSIIIKQEKNNETSMIMIKESGKNKSMKKIEKEEWSQLNGKYLNSKVEFLQSKKNILGYECKLAKIILADNSFITVYFTEKIKHPFFQQVEPMFNDIPGVVLKYEYQIKKSTLSYTATQLSRNKIDPDVFAVK